MNPSILVVFALCGLSLPLLGQQSGSASVERASGTPQFAGVFHPARGFQAGKELGSRVGPDSLYNNNTLTNYFSIPGQDQEWIDEGVLLDRNTNSMDQINGFNFTYCDTSLTTTRVSVTFNFYDEVSVCGGPLQPAWPNSSCSYGIPDLPGAVNGNLACWIVTVDLTGVECNLESDPSGQKLFGFGQVWDNSTTGPWLGQGGQGNENSYVWFDAADPNPATAYQGCFGFFGGAVHAGFAFEAFGNPAETLSFTHAGGQGADEKLVLVVDQSVQVGNRITFTVLDGAFGPPIPSALWVSSQRVDRKVAGLDAHELAQYSARVYSNWSADGEHMLLVPNRPGVWYTQAAELKNGMVTAMSNGLQHTVF